MRTDISTSKNRAGRSSAFSLIELMTAVSIMAILATIATPGLQVAIMNAQQAAAMGNARGIAHGMRTYAQDNEGMFPGLQNEEGDEVSTSNEAFRQLVPEYIDSERVFSVKRSAWGSRADGRIDEPEDRLQAGENHFAYVAGLFDTSRSDWPLIVDGTNGSGTYSSVRGEKGGCWEGRKAIVISVSGSARTTRLSGDKGEKFIPREGYPEENALEVSAYMGENAQLLDPE